MAINFSKTWEQRALEASESSTQPIADGNYVAKITNAAITIHPLHKVDVIDINLEIVTPGSEFGKTTVKTLFVDEDYKNAKKRKWDLSVLYELLEAHNLQFSNQRELVLALLDLRDVMVNLKISRSEKVNENGRAFINREISPITDINKINKASVEPVKQTKKHQWVTELDTAEPNITKAQTQSESISFDDLI
ncbi:hypothetical protein HLA87_02545 [Mycoplasma miroungigenitalium]|uniref:DUF669 domain-containing protein n=1 Tax=Mycoplasma miroungigenitalium TaxID=754515 RepID=A0A6M4J9M9_9MOLU|nr:hypothetical protein [Mycoplasma miroungigenitalium]QJR43653.1 hypothetical protein HLA87_02545 [Mycoplasma miroungigenitalium]